MIQSMVTKGQFATLHQDSSFATCPFRLTESNLSFCYLSFVPFSGSSNLILVITPNLCYFYLFFCHFLILLHSTPIYQYLRQYLFLPPCLPLLDLILSNQNFNFNSRPYSHSSYNFNLSYSIS